MELESILSSVYSGLCHQDPLRLLIVENRALPVCARCYGLQIGFAAAFGVAALARRIRVAQLTRPAAAFVIATIALLVVDWGLGRQAIHSSAPLMRLTTGLMCGAGLALLLSWHRGVCYDEATELPTLGLPHAAVILVGAVVGGLGGIALHSWVIGTVVLAGATVTNAAVVGHWCVRRAAVQLHGMLR